MFNDLKKAARKNAMISFFICIIVCVIILIIFSSSIIKLFKGPVDLYDLPVDKLSGAYVKGDMYALIDNFAQYYVKDDDGSEDVTQNYYIIPIGNEEYFALEVSDADMDWANRLYDETYDYFLGNRDELSTTIEVTGTIGKMDDDIYNYYIDWFKTSGFIDNPTDEEINRIALPYVLRVDYVGNFDDVILYIFMGIIVVLFLIAIFSFINGFSNSYLSPVKKYLKRNDSLYSKERIETDYETAVAIEHVRIGDGWTYYLRGLKIYIIKNSDILWAYLEEVTHRTYGIKTRVTKSLIVYDKDKKKYTIPMKKKDSIASVLEVYSQRHPHIVLGFNDDLKKCFRKDFEVFLTMSKRNALQSDDTITENSFL